MYLDEYNTTKEIDILDFIKAGLLTLSHLPSENLKYTIILAEIFRIVAECHNSTYTLKISDITDFICEVFCNLIELNL